MINPSTNLLELIVVSDKESHTMACAFNCSWLCCYPRLLTCLHDKGTKFTGIKFQELLQFYGIKAVIMTTANHQTNAILECTHQVIVNQLWSLCLMSIKLNSLADIQQEFLAPVQWAIYSTYHTTLQATSTQLAFHCDMIMPTSYMAHWQSICQRCQVITNHDNLCKNVHQVPHTYSVGDLVLIHQDTHSKLANPTHGPYHLIDVACQHVNGTIMFDLNHSHKTFNIWWLIPFKPHQNHWGHDLLYHMPHHIISLLVIMIDTSGLSPHMLSLLENPFTFFTNTCHLLQHYHLSFSTKKDCTFPCNTVVNIDVTPCLLVCHIIT